VILCLRIHIINRQITRIDEVESAKMGAMLLGTKVLDPQMVARAGMHNMGTCPTQAAVPILKVKAENTGAWARYSLTGLK
jgi:hypothetical protein